MKNLQQFHVKIVKKLGKVITQKGHKKFIKLFVINLINDKSFLKFFKKKIRIFIKYKKDLSLKEISNKILSTSSNLEIAKILSNLDLKYSQKLFGVLIHAYLQFKENSNVDILLSSKQHHNSKIKLVQKLKKAIIKKNYNVALFIWGSFLMKKIRFNLFSDIDCVLIIDDGNLLIEKNIKKFLLSLFEEIDTVHYNFPKKNELKWLRKNSGVARCGLIKNGIFVNFKIITKKTLNYSAIDYVRSLKEANQGYFLIPDFNNINQLFINKNSIPVYPFVKVGFIYKACRGLIPEFFHTGKLISCSNSSLKSELTNIQKRYISKSIGFIKAYNNHLNNQSIVNQILKLSYTQEEEMNKRKKHLLKFYNKIFKDIKNHRYILDTFLLKVYGELTLPLLEKTPKYWSHYNLLAFFVGASGKQSLDTITRRAFFQYFKMIRNIQNYLDPAYIRLIIDEIKNYPESLLKLKLNKKEKILLAVSLIDIIEKFCTNRSDFYNIVEIMFKNIFPKEHQRAFTILRKLLTKIDGRKKLNLLVQNMKNNFKKINPHIVDVKYRIRQTGRTLSTPFNEANVFKKNK